MANSYSEVDLRSSAKPLAGVVRVIARAGLAGQKMEESIGGAGETRNKVRKTARP
jgi:hypothetical protein